MIIYIAGKIEGEPNYKALFSEAEKLIKEDGHIALNPAMLPEGMPKEKYLPICFAMLDQADAIFLLDNYEDSLGARIESLYASYQQKILVKKGAEP